MPPDHVVTLDRPATNDVSAQLADMTKLAFCKAVAHHADSISYPLEGPQDSLERIFLRAVDRFPKRLQESAQTKVLDEISTRKDSAVAAQIDFTSSSPVQDQLSKAVRETITNEFAETSREHSQADHASTLFVGKKDDMGTAGEPFDDAGDRPRPGLPPGIRPRPGATQATKLILRLESLKCVKRTDDWGDEDEIQFGGTWIDARPNRTGKYGPVDVADDFKSGKVVNFRDLRGGSQLQDFVTFSLTEPVPWQSQQRTFAVVFLLSESDFGDFAEVLKEVADSLKSEVSKQAGKVDIPILPDLIARALNSLLDYIASLFKDDLFDGYNDIFLVGDEPKTVGCKSAEQIATFIGFGGEYELRYFWTYA